MTPNFKTMLIGFLIAAALIFAVIATGHAAEPIAPARVPETPVRQHVIPKTPALLVMATTQCNRLVAIVALMPDGLVVGFDKESKVDYKEQIDWVNTSEHIFVVEAACRIEPGNQGI